jgi:SAM-dependent methyltransferase
MKITEVCVGCGSKALHKNPAVLMPFVSDRVFGWKPFTITGLRDIPSGTAYALCNTLRCQRCGLVFCDMRFDEDEMKRLYCDYRGKAYTELRIRYETGYAERNAQLIQESHVEAVEQFLELHAAPESILDFGGGDGTKTPFADRTSICDVYDIGGMDVIRGHKITRVTDEYDLVVCAHVLEHVSDPNSIMQTLKLAMKPGAVLYIELPLESADEKQHWHEHINVFNRLSVYYLVEQVNMNITKYAENEVNGMKLIQVCAESL